MNHLSKTLEVISPPPFFNVTREEWTTTPMSVRKEIIRAYVELRDGLAIHKDELMGRAKRDQSGFYGLSRAEDKLWLLVEGGGSSRGKRIAALRANIAERRAKLMGDESEIARRIDAVEKFTPVAEVSGLSLADWIARNVGLEETFRSDPIAGIFKTCDAFGRDPLALLAQAQRQAGH